MNEDGQTSTIRDKILTIDVQPGWKQGTRITFEKEGDQVMTVVGNFGPSFLGTNHALFAGFLFLQAVGRWRHG